MASNFHIQTPYALATLPRPLNTSGDAYVVGDVWGRQAGSKRKRRPEVVLGIDGEAVNLYDVPSSRLITSYPIPPQSSFTCAPCSTRLRFAGSKDIARYTYISTKEPTPKITLFKDVLGVSGDTKSTNVCHVLEPSRKVVHLSHLSVASSTGPGSSLAGEGTARSELIAVTEDGSIICLHGEALQPVWTVSPETLTHNMATTSKVTDLHVDFVQTAAATEVIEGILGGQHDAFKVFPQQIESGAFNPDVLVLVTRSSTRDGETRWLHVLVISAAPETNAGARVIPVHSCPIPSADLAAGRPATYRLDVPSGCLLESRGECIVTYNLSRSVVRAESTLEVPGIRAFLRLSRSSVLAATQRSLDVYNTTFHALQASTTLGADALSKDPVSSGGPEMRTSLVTYFARLEIAVGIIGTSLIAVQLESPRLRIKKRRPDGLLVDALGRGAPGRTGGAKKHYSDLSESSVFTGLLPGSVTDDYWSRWTVDSQRADELFVSGNVVAFEELLAHKFSITVRPAGAAVGKQGATSGTSHAGQKEGDLPEWDWPTARADYPRVDRRWVLFAIARVFSWQEEDPEIVVYGSSLGCRLPDSNLVNYLIYAGHLTLPNVRSAFRDALRGVDDIEYTLGEELPQLLVEIDPTFELLVAYLSSTKLGPTELLAAVRLIMQSLELVQDPARMAPQLLASGLNGAENDDKVVDSNTDSGEIAMELDRLEHQLEVTEHYLGNESSTRARGLSIAFGKLGSCPAVSTIRALRRGYRPEEILSLIYVLRVELVKDGWTTRYLDTTRLDQDEELEPPPDGSIRLIADLLCRCLDSVGPGGWLINDAILAAGGGVDLDSVDFLASLRLEVSAALEGVQEAVFLRGIVSEAVRFGINTQKGGAGATSGGSGRKALGSDLSAKGEPAMLPFGMKAKSRISAEKTVSGGEVVNRTKREVGHLVSKKVGAYSLDRIAV